MKKASLYIDTDMGVDDILAICMIIASNKFLIRGISVVNGVATLSRGIKNLNRLLTYLNISCPIYVGSKQSEQGSSVQFPTIDRKRANTLALLAGIKLPTVGRNLLVPLLEAKHTLQKNLQASTLFAIGPLTNIVMLTNMSVINKRINRMVIMVGNVNVPGIVPPLLRTEYNIRLDPAAANKIFNSGLPVTLIPLDATKQTPTNLKNVKGKTKQSLVQFYQQLEKIKPASRTGLIMKNIIKNNEGDFNNFYDPLAAAILIDPTLITEQLVGNISVSQTKKTLGTITYTPQIQSNNKIVLRVNAQKFYQTLIKLIKK